MTLSRTITLGALGFAVATLAATQTADAAAKKCLFVSSYHQGYAWSDGVEQGLRSVLDGHCEVRQFDMDTKRQKSEEDKQRSALEAKALIEEWQPDVVITADDNAAKYLIKPYFKDDPLPFVFCGVNWTAKEYGFPYSNVTGMLEVAPILPMLERAKEIEPGMRRAFYLGASTLTEEKNMKRFEAASERLGLELDHALVGSTADWLEAYERAQSYDLVIIGSNAGINDWDSSAIHTGILRSAKVLSVTNHGWMMPYTMLGVTKIPEEQGTWAAKTALKILEGAQPGDIPIVANNQRDIWINQEIVAAAEVSLPSGLIRKGKRVAGLEAK